jgi:hypothetical protein
MRYVLCSQAQRFGFLDILGIWVFGFWLVLVLVFVLVLVLVLALVEGGTEEEDRNRRSKMEKEKEKEKEWQPQPGLRAEWKVGVVYCVWVSFSCISILMCVPYKNTETHKYIKKKSKTPHAMCHGYGRLNGGVWCV